MNCTKLICQNPFSAVGHPLSRCELVVLDVLGSSLQLYGPAYGHIMLTVPLPVAELMSGEIKVYQVDVIDFGEVSTVRCLLSMDQHDLPMLNLKERGGVMLIKDRQLHIIKAMTRMDGTEVQVVHGKDC